MKGVGFREQGSHLKVSSVWLSQGTRPRVSEKRSQCVRAAGDLIDRRGRRAFGGL